MQQRGQTEAELQSDVEAAAAAALRQFQKARPVYMVRERNPDADSKVIAVGDKGYVGSRNLAKPVRESQLVDDNVTITAPPGAVILDRDERQNGYGCYTYISYLLPEPRPEPARRRRKIE